MENITNITVGPYGMIIAMPLFIILAGVSYLLTPRRWRHSPQEKSLIILFHVCGCVALAGLTSWFCTLPDSWFKWFVTYFQTFYINFLLIATVALLIAHLVYKINKKVLDKDPTERSYRAVWLFSLGLCLLFTFVNVYHDDTVLIKQYSVSNNKAVPEQGMKIALCADSHIGAGAKTTTLGYITDRFNTMNPDLLILDGDIVDGTTSESDLELLTSTLKNINPQYGKYFVMGNHDDNCLFDFQKALTDAGVVILQDEAVRLSNGAILVGKKDTTKIGPAEIMNNCSISEDEYSQSLVILAQHRPERANLYKTQCDIMLCGHTHGIHFPTMNPFLFFTDKLLYGQCYYGDMCAITTSGVSSWGFHAKWPSCSEIVEIDVSK